MKIQYLEDVPLPELWSSDALFDPLHPGHGPLPNMQGLLEAGGERYTVAVWDTGDAILTMLEMIKDESPHLDDPLLTLEEVYTHRGWILQTYRWVQGREGMFCQDCRVTVPEYPGVKEEEIWMREIYRRLMEGSVYLALTTAPGISLQTIRRLSRLTHSP
jgi:hypothetical protein